MSTTLTPSTVGLQGALKEYYTRVREDVVPRLTALWAQFKKIKQGGPRNFGWTGRGVRFDAVMGDYTGWNYSDAGYLGDSHWRGETQGTTGVKRLYARQKFDRITLAAMRRSDGSYITLGEKIDEEFQGKMALGLQEGLFGDGRGIKAIVTNVNSQSSLDVESPYGLSGAGQGALWLQTGLRISVRDGSAPATKRTFSGAESTTISAIALQTAPDTYRLTLAVAGTGIAVGDFIIGSTSYDDAYNASPNGLLNAANRSGSFDSFLGISGASTATPGGSPDGHPRWNTTRINAGATSPMQVERNDQLTDSDLWDLCLRVAAKSGKNPLTNPKEWLIVTTPGLKKGYKESRIGFVQMSVSEVKQLEGGWGYDADYNGIPIMDDVHCPIGHVFLLHLKSWGWVDAEEWGVVAMPEMDEFRWIPDMDGFETSKGIYFNTICTARSTIGVIYGYTEPSVRYTPVAY